VLRKLKSQNTRQENANIATLNWNLKFISTRQSRPTLCRSKMFCNICRIF